MFRKDTPSAASPAEEETPADPGTPTDPGTDDPPPARAACGATADGASYAQVRYQSGSAILGLASCVAEAQTCTCSDGTVACTGTYTAESCSTTTATLAAGDILVMHEVSTSVSGPTPLGNQGHILAFSKTGTFKGVAFENKVGASSSLMRYPRGMALQRDPFGNEFSLLVGTADASLKMDVLKFPEILTPASTAVRLSEPQRLASPIEVSESNYFDFGFTPISGGKFYNSTFAADVPGVNFYDFSSGSTTGLNSCNVEYAGAFAGWRIQALWNAIRPFGFNYILSLRTSGGSFAVDKITNCTDGGGDPSPTFLVGDSLSNAKGMDVFEFRDGNGSAHGSWDQDLFVTVTPRLGGVSRVLRYDNDGAGNYTLDSAPFQNDARAAFYFSDLQNGVFKKIVTLEDDGSSRHLRRYDYLGTLEATLYSTNVDEVLPEANTGLGVWIVQLPE